MKYPEEVDLMFFFECEPGSLDSENIPFFYNQSTYKYINPCRQIITLKICPSYQEIKILVKRDKFVLSNIHMNSVSNLTILSDRKEEKRMMITSENYLLKLTIKPEFQFELVEEKDV